MATHERLVAPAAERNKESIFHVLKNYLGTQAQVLEVGSGTGQHVSFFASLLPHVTWQPTDIEDEHLRSISSYIVEENLNNVKKPTYLDITKPLRSYGSLEPESCDMILNCNMIHISPWETSTGLFKFAGQSLKANGILFMYGPFRLNGLLTPESNVIFHKRLRLQDSSWGIRDTSDLDILAEKNGLKFETMVDMPANNKCRIYRKCPAN